MEAVAHHRQRRSHYRTTLIMQNVSSIIIPRFAPSDWRRNFLTRASMLHMCMRSCSGGSTFETVKADADSSL